VIGSQIFNLIPNPSFDHNSYILGLNKICKGILNIYTLIHFQWYLGGSNWCLFTLSTNILNIQDSTQVQLPKWECTWESLDSISYILPHLWKCNVSLLNTLNHEHEVRVVTTTPLSKYNIFNNLGNPQVSWVGHLGRLAKLFIKYGPISYYIKMVGVMVNIMFVNVKMKGFDSNLYYYNLFRSKFFKEYQNNVTLSPFLYSFI